MSGFGNLNVRFFRTIFAYFCTLLYTRVFVGLKPDLLAIKSSIYSKFMLKLHSDNKKEHIMKITDFKASYKDLDTAIRAAKMFELRKQVSISVLDGKFREARKQQKELAKAAVDDFETYKTLPFIHFIMKSFPLKSVIGLMINTLGFKIFNKFSKKTQEEKQLLNLSKEYYRNLTKDDIKNKTIDVVI